MEKTTRNALSWAHIILGVLIGITVALNWPVWLLYTWAVLVLLSGVWELTA